MIYIVSKGERFHTFAMLNAWGLDYTVVTHTTEQMRALLPHIEGRKIVVTLLPNLLDQRNFINAKLAKESSWFVGMDDNIRSFTELRYPYRTKPKIDVIAAPPRRGKSWAWAFNHQVECSRYKALVDMLINECERRNTIYGGFASADVALWRQKRWSYMRFVKSKFFVMRNVVGLRWQGGNVAHDSWMSAFVAQHYGGTCVYNYAHPVHKMFEHGGLGSLQERRAQLEVELAKIVRQFPGLVRRADGPNAALAFTRRAIK